MEKISADKMVMFWGNPGENRCTCVNVSLGVHESDAEIVYLMKELKRVREENAAKEITCTIAGFDSDPRELWEIPEVALFCQKLVQFGFCSLLSLFGAAFPELAVKGEVIGFGAAEIWLISHGKFQPNMDLPGRWRKEAVDFWLSQNEIAERVCGPFQRKAKLGDALASNPPD